MSEDDTSNESDNIPSQFTAVELVYDEASNYLNAVLSITDIDPQINWTSLQQMIVENDFESFKVPNTVLQEVLRKVQNVEIGVIPLAEKPKYTAVNLVMNEESKTLDAVLSDAEFDHNINLMSLQEMIRDNGFEAFQVNGAALQSLLKSVAENDTGVYRIGELPEYTALDLVFDDDTHVLSAELSTTYENPSLSLESIQQSLEENGYNSLFYDGKALEKLLERIEKKERGTFPLAQKKDAEFSVQLADDKMTATITTKQAYGGKQLTEEFIRLEIDALELDKKICKKEVIQQAINHEELDNVILAKGKAPSNGEDAYFTALVEEVIYSGPKVDEKGIADLREVNEFTVVDIDTPLMEKTPASPGKLGFNILGQIVTATAGNDIEFDKDIEGAGVDPNNEYLLIATSKGHPLIKDRGVSIDKTLHVKNVNPRIGNINFDGSLMVDGDVTAGVKIDVTGSIVIKGVVTHADINAGGDITINGGVIGDVADAYDKNKENEKEEEEDGQVATQLSAGGEIKAKYLSLASITAGKNITVAEYCSHCNIATQSKFLLGQQGGKGRLMGGTCYARTGVYAKVLGTDANIKTYVKAGYLAEHQEKHDDLVAKRKSAVEQANELATTLIQIIEEGKRVQLPAGKIETAKKIRSSVELQKKEVGEMAKNIKRMKVMFKRYRNMSVEVGSKVYPNVFITVNGIDFTIRNESKGGKFIRVGNDIRWEA